MGTAVLFTNQSTTSQRRDAVELAVGYAAIMAAIWTPLPWAAACLLLGLVWVVLRVGASRASLSDLGLRLSAITRDYWVIPFAAVLTVLGAFLGAHFNTLHPPFANTRPELHAGMYLVWALIQQFILQDFFLPRLLRLLPTRSAAVITAAGLFASAHIPNPLLVAATMLWGVIACTLFLRYRDLLTLGIAHAVLGLSLAFTLPAPLHHQMRVGLGYLRWHPEQVQQSQNGPSAQNGIPAVGTQSVR
jgi:hypothetical protein